MDRVERHEVLSRFNKTLFTQKISANRSDYSVESSPIGSPRKDGSRSRGTSNRGSKSPVSFKKATFELSNKGS